MLSYYYRLCSECDNHSIECKQYHEVMHNWIIVFYGEFSIYFSTVFFKTFQTSFPLLLMTKEAIVLPNQKQEDIMQKENKQTDSDTLINNNKTAHAKPVKSKLQNKAPNSLPQVKRKNNQITIRNAAFSSNQHSLNNNQPYTSTNKASFPCPSPSSPPSSSRSNSAVPPPASQQNVNNITNHKSNGNGNNNNGNVIGRKSKRKQKQRQIDNSSNNHNTNSSNGTVINYQHKQNNIHIMNGHMMNNHSLVRDPKHFSQLIEKFGCPNTVSDFNMMAIAGVLQEGQHIH